VLVRELVREPLRVLEGLNVLPLEDDLVLDLFLVLLLLVLVLLRGDTLLELLLDLTLLLLLEVASLEDTNLDPVRLEVLGANLAVEMPLAAAALSVLNLGLNGGQR